MFGAVVMILGATILWALLAAQANARPATPAPRRAAISSSVSEGPSIGYPGTFFHVRFRAPGRTGKVGAEERYYVISASGPSAGGNCASQISQYAGFARAHARVRVTLKPGPYGWCLGSFHGTVTEQERPICPYREVCPMYVILVRKLGNFSFTVQAQPPGGDTTPPVFAGLDRAVACTPGPERPGETVPYHLSWHPAHDAVTPSSQLVYDIFMSSTPGGENFSQPTWTTAPGTTNFQTPGLPSNESVYFVVRARDRAGNEDSNDGERQGIDPCV
jgi:hypothetical protein